MTTRLPPPRQTGRTAGDQSDTFQRGAEAFCAATTGRRPERIERLGGRARAVARVHFADGTTAIVCRRDEKARAALEAQVLRALAEQNAPAPRLLAAHGRWLMQQDLGRHRLAEHLVPADRNTCRWWMERGAESLLHLQTAGTAAGLHARVAPIGRRPGWTGNLILAPDQLAALTGIPVPGFHREAADLVLRVAESRFIKWDARPGNAIAGQEEAVTWFDFEHCGCRDPLDDLAWLLFDEYVPDDPLFENDLLKDLLPRFASRRHPDDARRYLAIMGVLHGCIRLSLIFKQKRELGHWLDEARCRRMDSIACTSDAVVRTARRAARWADEDRALRALAPWLLRIAAEAGGFKPGIVADRGLRLQPAA